LGFTEKEGIKECSEEVLMISEVGGGELDSNKFVFWGSRWKRK
jgi:hypothetical protein